jgi:hypothetical protein
VIDRSQLGERSGLMNPANDRFLSSFQALDATSAIDHAINLHPSSSLVAVGQLARVGTCYSIPNLVLTKFLSCLRNYFACIELNQSYFL